jgi:hypothetical protein
LVKAGAVLLTIGIAALIGYGLYQLLRVVFSDPEIPLLVQVAVVASLIGLTLLSIAVVRDRLRARRRERFEEMDN